jgi:hypothetical protein
MRKTEFNLPDNLREALATHFVMLEPLNRRRKVFKTDLWVNGYAHMTDIIADLVKVSMLALESIENADNNRIPEPGINISGVLSLILDMLPYEEAQLLDTIYEQCLPQEDTTNTPKPEEHHQEEWSQCSYSTIIVYPILSN